MMKSILSWLVYMVVIVVALVFCLVGSIDRRALHEQPFYHDMMRELDTIKYTRTEEQKTKIGWGKYNITPSFDMPMAGYKPRNHFESVHDSLFVRIIEIDNGTPFFIISADLLIFPPVLREKIEVGLAKVLPKSFLYFSATHTHNGVGGWDNSLAGQFVAGRYNDEWVNQIGEGIINTLVAINKTTIYGSISYCESDATGYAANRLADDGGKVDAKLRGIKFMRENGSKAIFTTFSAHATSISKEMRILSGDYPTVMSEELEKKGYDFAMFAAGMVGSHRLDGFTEDDFELTAKAGKVLAAKILHASNDSNKMESISLTSAHLPLQYGPSQLRLETDLRLRDWAFRSLLRPLGGEITFLEIGEIIMLGTPCDFSGELSVYGKFDSLATVNGKKLIISSFNGDYTGYITFDDHYDHYKKEEVMALNWVGPHFGQYYQEIITRLLAKD